MSLANSYNIKQKNCKHANIKKVDRWYGTMCCHYFVCQDCEFEESAGTSWLG